MATTALGLALQISASTAGLAQSVNEVNKKLDEMAEAGKKSAKDLAILKTIEISRVLIDGVKTLAGALSSAASSAKGLFDDARAAIDRLGKLSDQTGIAVETLQSYAAAADLSGVSNEELAKSLQKMQVNLGKLDAESDKDPFSKLGLSVTELQQQGAEATFEAIAESISNLATDAEKAAIANEIFGRGGVTLLPLLNQGAEALKAQREETEQLGILNREQVKGVEAMNDAFSKVGHAVASVVNLVTAELAGPIEAITNQVLDMIKAIGTANIANFITEALFGFADAFLSGLEVFASVLGQVAEGVLTILRTLGAIDESPQQKELDEIRREATVVTVRAGRQARRTEFRPTEEQAARIAELEQQIEAQQQAGGLTNMMVSGIADLRATLQDTRESFASPAVPPEAQVDATKGVEDAVDDSADSVVEAIEEQTNELRAPTVDILGAAA